MTGFIFPQLILRAGLSEVSGLLGAELKIQNISICGGVFKQQEKPKEAIYDSNTETRTPYVIGLNYYLKPSGNSTYFALSYLADAYIKPSDLGPNYPPEWLVGKNAIIGYRFTSNKKYDGADLRFGIGIRVLPHKTGLAFDFSLGYWI